MKIVVKKIGDLNRYEKNARKHSHRQVDLLVKNIKEFGFTTAVLIDGENNVIAGHGRLLAMEKLEREEVPCVVMSDLTPDQVKALRIADNKIASMGGWDFELVTEELKSLSVPLIDLTGFGKEFKIHEMGDLALSGSQGPNKKMLVVYFEEKRMQEVKDKINACEGLDLSEKFYNLITAE
ncbi:MAG TPA: hypothetical protein ENI08_02245 [Candidatus Dependentiae bacterium]|nr:hypothetical protein [Candidatus Dependentiae bacterium]